MEVSLGAWHRCVRSKRSKRGNWHACWRVTYITEVQCQLYVALDAGYISSVEFKELQDLAASAKRCLGGFMKYLRRSPLRGQKFNRARAAVTDE